MGLGILDWFSNKKPQASVEPTQAELDYQNAIKDIAARDKTMAFANRIGKPKAVSIKKEPVIMPQRKDKDLLSKQLSDDKYNRDNKYRVNGLGISNRVGDYISNVANRLF